MTHSAVPYLLLFCSYHTLMSSVIYHSSHGIMESICQIDHTLEIMFFFCTSCWFLLISVQFKLIILNWIWKKVASVLKFFLYCNFREMISHSLLENNHLKVSLHTCYDFNLAYPCRTPLPGNKMLLSIPCRIVVIHVTCIGHKILFRIFTKGGSSPFL